MEVEEQTLKRDRPMESEKQTLKRDRPRDAVVPMRKKETPLDPAEAQSRAREYAELLAAYDKSLEEDKDKPPVDLYALEAAEFRECWNRLWSDTLGDFEATSEFHLHFLVRFINSVYRLLVFLHRSFLISLILFSSLSVISFSPSHDRIFVPANY